MAASRSAQLEESIRSMPGVLGCVIVNGPGEKPAEVQALVSTGSDRMAVQNAILEEVARRDLGPVRQVFVFELDTESHFGDAESVRRAAEQAELQARSRGPLGGSSPPLDLNAIPGAGIRPRIGRVALTASSWRAEARVALDTPMQEVVGEATGEETAHGLRILAEATLEALRKLSGELEFVVVGSSLIGVFGREAVLVVVRLDQGEESIGSSLVKDGRVSEAAVRACLDAVNRRLSASS